MRTKRRNQLKNGNKQKKNPGNSSITKWKKREDIEFDEEDAFHENRDRIMLEGEEGVQSDDDLKNEVFALNNLHEDSESSDELEEVPDDSDVEPPPPPKVKKPKATQEKKVTNDLVESSSESEDQVESWGRKKSAYYSTNAAAIESDDEEAQRLEEAEVKRLQTLARAGLQEEDFGFNDVPSDSLVNEIEAPAPILPVSQDPETLIRHLQKTSPETLALAREWEDVAYDLAQSQRAIDRIDKATSGAPAVGMLQLYHQTLLTYATTLAFYLHMRAQPKYATNPKLLQAHPILPRLLSLKQAMSSLERLDFGPNSDGSGEDDESDEEEDEEEDMRFLWGDRDLAAMDDMEFEDLLKDAREVQDVTPLVTKKKKKADVDVSKKSKSDDKKKKKSKAPVFDLEEPEFISASALNGVKTKHKSAQPDTISAFGEYTSLDATDAQDKSARKKSLRFHTARIESAASRRVKARGAAMQGDDDIPYRERQKQKEEREAKESQRRAEKGLLGAGGEDLDSEGGEGLGRGVKRPRDDEEEDVGADGYYELVKRQKREEREEKQSRYDAQKAEEKAAREGDGFDEGESGPRSLTRAILKNKGLTPSRSKSVRNPRVKKRMKYDEAKKKVRSQKAVFKGGLASTGGKYAGETSGISTRVVKSVKLG